MDWYGNNVCTFGQKLGAFARLYLVTEDERLREKALALADGWGECASLNRCWKEGYSFSFRTKPGHVKPFAHLTRDFYPYYEVGEREWYYMYNRIEENE